ncbi:heme oxygenase (biliverdin-producing) [Propionibacteriaceae bacterium Y2011]|uniref:biliverdin-producing heme oxygenase n=1 Tax=Microlunatus sp. Y2014 TaxID=3418488 RepID=UPI003B4536B9
MVEPLSVALRTETSQAHQDAEGSAFIEQLMGGAACQHAFAALVAQQLVIYRALEDVLHADYADHPMVAPVLDHRLDRVAALERDMAQLFGSDHDVRLAAGQIRICRATTEYATVLRTQHSPEMMLANHYVRYLGDLSGGQVIARLVERNYGISPAALNFYRFDGIPKPKPYKDAYRDRLDAIELDPTQRRAVIDAAVTSFELNRRVFADLGAAREPEHTAAGVAR